MAHDLTRQRVKILVADDDPTLRMVMEAFIRKMGYEVLLAENGQQAVDLFESDAPDLVILDVNMPVMDGFTACSTLKQHPSRPNVPVLMVTGLSDDEDIERVFAMGADEYISKPLHWVVLKARIEWLLKRRWVEQELEHRAFYDVLTDLPNRQLLIDSLSRSLAHNRRRNTYSALMFLDLDNFKTVNDTLGHHVGDDLLKRVASKLRSALRNEDIVARMGGDEFVVMLGELDADLEEASQSAWIVSEKLIDLVAEKVVEGGVELKVGTSIGIAMYPVDEGESEQDVDTILMQADTAMYEAKDGGRNRAAMYHPSMREQAMQRLTLLNALTQAVSNEDFELYFQPQYDADRQLHGAEVLLRWFNKDAGEMVSPADFIPLAEETSLVVPIGEWVLNEACQIMAGFIDVYGQAPFPGVIAVNISPRQFEMPGFVGTVEAALQKSGLSPDRLELELTEGLLIHNVEAAIKKMWALKKMGVRFSIDDFGTGYSSLTYLSKMPLDKLKIDKSFVDTMLESRQDAVLVRTIITLAHNLNLDVIAEGVETSEQFEVLAKDGCGLYQGYYFGRPVPAKSFLQELMDAA